MNDKTVTAPLHDNLRDLIGQAISDEIAGGAEQPDWCDSREIDRLADAVMAVLPKRRTTLSPELRAALDEAAKTGATVVEVLGGSLVFINRGEQPEDGLDLNCPACGGSGHADDARDASPAPAGADDAFAAFCDREGYPSDGPFDAALRKAFDAGRAAHPLADAAPVDAEQAARSKWTVKQWYEHVGAWEGPQGEVCFGSVMALGAMLKLMAKARLTTQPSTAQRNALSQKAGDERKAFEAWARPDRVQAVTEGHGFYTEPGMSAAWSAWIARSALAQRAVSQDSERDAALLEKAAQTCDQQADGTNGPYRSACLQCADAVRALRDAAIVGQDVAKGGAA